MKYFSSRDSKKEHPYSLKDAAFMGLAPDGGLFIPEYIPQADMSIVESLAEKSYAEMALYLAGLFFGDDIPEDELRAMIMKAYDFDCPLVKVSEGDYALELFHGPTFAFKDFGARFMGGMLGILSRMKSEENASDSDEMLTVLTATSGDTGSAVAAGFHNVPGVQVVVLYPEGKVSDLQESQMTTLGGNIHAVRVKGNFDDCQALVKGVFNDSEFRKNHYVTSANSINLLRWIPQSFYYFYGWCQWKKATGKTEPDIVVPSGNYGNITAGMLTHFMGMPVRRFVAGSNANDVVPAFLRSGVYSPRASVRTVANAMDVGAPSNYERMMYLYDHDFSKLTASVSGYSYDDAQIKAAMKELFEKNGYVSDPHSAVAYNTAKDCGMDGFRLSTAHSAKFLDVLHDALGPGAPDSAFAIPEGLRKAMEKPKEYTVMENSLKDLESFVDKL